MCSAICWINSAHTVSLSLSHTHTHTHTHTLAWALVLPRGRAGAHHLGHLWGHFCPGSVSFTPTGWGTVTPTSSRLQILSHPLASFLSTLVTHAGWGVMTFLFRLWLRGCSWGQSAPHPPQVLPVLQALSLTLFFSLFVFPFVWSLSSISGSPSSCVSPFSWLTFSFLSFLPSFNLCSGSHTLAVWPWARAFASLCLSFSSVPWHLQGWCEAGGSYHVSQGHLVYSWCSIKITASIGNSAPSPGLRFKT